MSDHATMTAELPTETLSRGSLHAVVSEHLPGFDPTEAEWVAEMNLQDRVNRAIALLKANEPEDGYYLAYSGGKDSDVCKKLCQLAGVNFEAWHNQTTIDPPELVRHIKAQPDVKWNLAKMNMMTRVAMKPAPPPTRMRRWCCDEYKERGGTGRTCVFGVRAEESAARKKRWCEVVNDHEKKRLVICPIVFWTLDQVWEFLRAYQVPYCSLYDEGWTRLGCVGCPLANSENQNREFARWPAFERNWKKAIIANWEKWKDVPREKDGLPRFHARFKTGEDFWQWWRYAKKSEIETELCQSELLFTNAENAEDLLANNQVTGAAQPRSV